jgi:hypothetical protein
MAFAPEAQALAMMVIGPWKPERVEQIESPPLGLIMHDARGFWWGARGCCSASQVGFAERHAAAGRAGELSDLAGSPNPLAPGFMCREQQARRGQDGEWIFPQPVGGKAAGRSASAASLVRWRNIEQRHGRNPPDPRETRPR